MYKEPHLQQKSDECAAMWREWFELFEKKDPREKEIRKKWCNCVTEFGEMVGQEVKTNPRYQNIRTCFDT